MKNSVRYHKDHYLPRLHSPRPANATATTTLSRHHHYHLHHYTTATTHNYKGQRLAPDRWCPIGQPTNMAARPTGNLAKWCNKGPPPGLGATTLSGGNRERPDNRGEEYHEGLDPQGLTNASRISHHTMLPPISRCDAPNSPPPSVGATGQPSALFSLLQFSNWSKFFKDFHLLSCFQSYFTTTLSHIYKHTQTLI